MKTLFITDLHDKSPKRLIARAISKGVRKIVCLGDLDDPTLLKDLFVEGIETKILVGNHDYHHVRGEKLYGNDFYWAFWQKAEKESDLIKRASLVEYGDKIGRRVVDSARDKKIVYAHASLREGEEGYGPNCLWDFLTGDKNLTKENFRIMQEKDFWILFRGHDHNQFIWSVYKQQLRDNSQDFPILPILSGFDKKIKLANDRRHIITIDSFVCRRYAIFDDHSMEIEFKIYQE